MEFGIWTALIACMGTLVGIFINLNNSKRNSNKEIEIKAREQGMIINKLDTIQVSIDSVKLDIKENKLDIIELTHNQAKFDEKLNGVITRVDKLESKIG